jgi:torulene dioxygenase
MSYFQKLKTLFEPGRVTTADQANIGVTIHPNTPGFPSVTKAGEKTKDKMPQVENLVTFTDASTIKMMDPDTLEPAGVTNQTSLHPDLNGVISCAHAQWDPVKGDIYNYNLAFGRSATYRIFRVAAETGKTEILATVSGKDIKAAYIHSLFLTEDYVILAVWPAYFAAGGAAILWERNVMDALSKFNSEDEVKWLVVDRKHGRGLVAKFSSPAKFVFHQINAWQEEKDGETDIYCDLIQYDNLDIIHRLYYQNLVSTGEGVKDWSGDRRKSAPMDFVRYRLPKIPSEGTLPSTAETSLKAEVVSQMPNVGELPTINPHYCTTKSRFVYTISDRGLSSWVDSLAKTDLETKETVRWEHPHHTPGEAIFIPDPNGTTEDAGYLLSVILDGDRGTSYLICLDARTMKELGRAECGVAVGIGFHGRHLPAKAGKL